MVATAAPGMTAIELNASLSGGGVSSYVRVGGAGVPSNGLWVGDDTSLYYNGVAVSGSSITGGNAQVECLTTPEGAQTINIDAFSLNPSATSGGVFINTPNTYSVFDTAAGAAGATGVISFSGGYTLEGGPSAQVYIAGDPPEKAAPGTLYVGASDITYAGQSLLNPTSTPLYYGTANCVGATSAPAETNTYYIQVATGTTGISATAPIVASVVSRSGAPTPSQTVITAIGYVGAANSYIKIVFSAPIATATSIVVSYAVFKINTTTQTVPAVASPP